MLIDDVEPVVDLTGPARELERAFGSVYDAFDGRADRLTAAREAAAGVDQAALAIAKAAELDPAFKRIGAHLDRAKGHLARVEALLAYRPPEPPPPDAELLASIDVPRLHASHGKSIVPALKVPAPPPAEIVASPGPALPRPTTFDELRRAIDDLKKRAPVSSAKQPPAEGSASAAKAPERVIPPGFAPAVGAAMDEVAFVRARAREHFEEVAMVGMQRAPLLGDPFRGSLALERRMLAAIDVIAALGRAAVEHVPRLLADAPVKDPSLGFAGAMVLGCFQGRDALAAAELALLSSDRDAAFIDAVGAALKLAPHDRLPLALRSLLGEADPLIRAMAIDVLGYRGAATDEELAAAAMDAPDVAVRALPYLAYRASPALDSVIERRLPSAEQELRDALFVAAALRGRSDLLALVEDALLREGSDAAAMLLALAGNEREARLLEERARTTPSVGVVTALGWAGAASSVELLIEQLDGGDEIRLAAAWALERVTGAGLWEEAVASEEEIGVADPPEPNVGERKAPKLSALVSDPRDAPPEPSPDLVQQPSTDPARWRAYWGDARRALDETARYRRGLAYTPLVVLSELDQGRCTPAERRLLQRELIVRTGGYVAFDPHDFVVVQERALAAWRPIAQRASSAPGRWVRPARRLG